MSIDVNNRAAAVIVAAGNGSRFGDTAKVLAPAQGRPLLAWSLDAFEAAHSVRDVVIVVGAHTEDAIRRLVATGLWTKVSAMVVGGANRQESVANGIAAVRDDLEIVLIHDAARPMIEPMQVDACTQCAATTGAAILAAPVADTLKRADGGRVVETVSRAGMWAAQTPQAFRLTDYRDALTRIKGREADFTDDASIFEALGRPVAIVPGTRLNVKVTEPEDLVLVDLLLRDRESRYAHEEASDRG